jgi:hypothetical protein
LFVENLVARSEEAAEPTPTRIYVAFVARRLHRLGARAEDLHRHLVWKGSFGITLQVKRPVLDAELAVVRGGEELGVAELEAEFRGLEGAVAGGVHDDADPQIQVQSLRETGDADLGIRRGYFVVAPVEVEGLDAEASAQIVPVPDPGAGAPEGYPSAHGLLFLDALQLVAAALNGLEELGEVVLEVREHLVGVVLGA